MTYTDTLDGCRDRVQSALKRGTPLESEHLTCTALCSRLSHSWALVCLCCYTNVMTTMIVVVVVVVVVVVICDVQWIKSI